MFAFWLFVINFVRLRTQSSLPISTWEFDHCLDCSLPLLTLLFLHEVPSISSLTLFFPTHSVNLFVYSRLWRTLWELITGWICLSPFDCLFPCPGHLYLLLDSLLWVTAWASLRGPDCGEHIANWLLASLLSPLLIPPLLLLVNYLPPPYSLLHLTWWTSLGSLTVEKLFIINLDVLSSMMYT